MIWPLIEQFWEKLGNFLFHHLVALVTNKCIFWTNKNKKRSSTKVFNVNRVQRDQILRNIAILVTFISFWQICKWFIYLEPTLAIFAHYLAIFIWFKWPNIEK